MDGDHPENFIAAGVFKNLLCLLRGSESSQFTPNYLSSGSSENRSSRLLGIMTVLRALRRLFQLKNLPYSVCNRIKGMTVKRNEPSFVSIIGKLDACHSES